MSAHQAVHGHTASSAPRPGDGQPAGSPWSWYSEWPVLVAMSGAAVAGGIHLAVVVPHLAEGWLIGGFFLVLGVAQLGVVVLLRRRLSKPVLVGVVGAHLAVIALYTATRTVDLPFVPPSDAGHSFKHLPVAGGVGNGIPVYPGSRIEPVGVLDAVCLVAELALIAAVVAMLPVRLRGRVTTVIAALAVLGLVARVLLMTTA